MSSGQFPVVVGGTNYYIESLLWKILIENSDAQSDDENDTHLSLYERDKYHVEQQQKQQEAGKESSIWTCDRYNMPLYSSFLITMMVVKNWTGLIDYV